MHSPFLHRFLLIYNFAVENFSSMKSNDAHATWSLQIFSWGVSWEEIMKHYKGGGFMGLGKKEEVSWTLILWFWSGAEEPRSSFYF